MGEYVGNILLTWKRNKTRQQLHQNQMSTSEDLVQIRLPKLPQRQNGSPQPQRSPKWLSNPNPNQSPNKNQWLNKWSISLSRLSKLLLISQLTMNRKRLEAWESKFTVLDCSELYFLNANWINNHFRSTRTLSTTLLTPYQAAAKGLLLRRLIFKKV